MRKEFAVIFDLDGTLLNTDKLIQESFRHVFEIHKPGYILSQEEHISFLGPTLKATFARYFHEDMIETLIQDYRDFNIKHHHDYVTIYPTVKETLYSLKSLGYPLAIVTTKQKQSAYVGLDLFAITDIFDVVLGMDDVAQVKPDPEGIIKAMEQLKCDKAIYIGDNPTDIQAGHNAGIYTAGVKWSPKGIQALEALCPHVMIDEMKDIITFIEEVE